MINSKFIQLYKCLDKAEKKKLLKWIRSPIYNQHEKVTELFEYLHQRKNITKTTTQKERIFEALFPDEEYDDAKLRHVQSYAFKVLEKFIGYNQIFKDRRKWRKELALYYFEHGLFPQSKQMIEEVEEDIYRYPYRNSDYQLELYQLEVDRFKMDVVQGRATKNNLPQLFEYASKYYIITALKYACSALTHRNIYNVDYEIPLLDAVLVYAKQLEDAPVVKLYYYAYCALSDSGTEEDYQQMKHHLFTYTERLNLNERYEVFQLTINYCIKRINTGNAAYFEEVFNLYKKGLETEVLFQRGVLSHYTYKNIVSAGLKLKQFDWVEFFIKTYSNRLFPKKQDNYRNYASAKLRFMKGDYLKSLRLLLQVEEYDDIFLTLDAKMMLLKIYVDEDTYEPLLALINSFKVYLKRKDILSYHKAVYQNILYFVNQLLQHPPQTELEREKLRQAIQEKRPLTEQNWLLEQLDKIKIAAKKEDDEDAETLDKE